MQMRSAAKDGERGREEGAGWRIAGEKLRNEPVSVSPSLYLSISVCRPGKPCIIVNGNLFVVECRGVAAVVLLMLLLLLLSLLLLLLLSYCCCHWAVVV